MDLEAFRTLLEPAGRELLAELGEYDESQALAVGSRLRTRHSADLVAAAMTQNRLRSRGRQKFGADAAVMYFTPDGLEQATRLSVATHRARRYVTAGARRVVDLCCGIGADTVALARAGLHVLAVDRDPLRCAITAANAEALGVAARVEVICDDVTAVSLRGYDAAFLDPARRTERGRVFDPRSYSPPWSFIRTLADTVASTGVKVGPGIDHAVLPPDAETEWVSDHGALKEAALYFGPLGGERRRATLLPHQVSLASTGVPDPVVREPRRYLYEPDDAVIRAHLIGELARSLAASLIDPTIAYLSSDEHVRTPYANCYLITDVMPFSVKRLRAAVRSRDIGALTVKKRGSAIDPAQLRNMVRPRGDKPATLVVTRVNGAPTALFVEPVPATSPSGRR